MHVQQPYSAVVMALVMGVGSITITASADHVTTSPRDQQPLAWLSRLWLCCW